MAMQPGRPAILFFALRRGIIFVLGGLLVFYHTYTLCDVNLAGHGTGLPWFGREEVEVSGSARCSIASPTVSSPT